MKKFNIKKGDNVIVNAGNDKGKTGKVLEVLRDKDRVIVEGVNMVSRHTKPNSKAPQGGIIKKEASIHISNVNLMDASGKAVKVGHKEVDGKKIRFARTTGEEIKYLWQRRIIPPRKSRHFPPDMSRPSRRSIKRRSFPLS